MNVEHLEDAQLLEIASNIYWSRIDQNETISETNRAQILNMINEGENELRSRALMTRETRGRVRSFVVTWAKRFNWEL
jgi:hypothetical protein